MNVVKVEKNNKFRYIYLWGFQIAHLRISLVDVMIVCIFWFQDNVVCLLYQLSSASSSSLSAVHCQDNDQAKNDDWYYANDYIDDL